MNKRKLNKPNELISVTSKDTITATQRKIYNNFLKHAQNRIKFDEYKGNLFKISCEKVHKRANLKNKNNDYLYNEFLKFMRIIVEISDRENPDNWEAFNLLSYIKKENGYYHYELNNKIISALKNQTFFTTLDLITIESLNSQYAIIFYELAIQYKKYKIPKMSIEEIRKLTNTENKYKRTEAFKRRVLDVACEEITEKTDIKLSYTEEKIGRRIAYINFVTEKQELEIEKLQESREEVYSEETLKLFEEVRVEEQTEIVKKELEKLILKYPYDVVESNLRYTNKKSDSNYVKYLQNAVRGDYAVSEREKIKKEKELEQKKVQEEKKKEKLEEQKEKNVEEEAKEIFEKMSDSVKKDYKTEYEKLSENIKRVAFQNDFDVYLLAKIKEEISKI